MKYSAVKILVAVNVAAYVLQSLSKGALDELFALWPLQSLPGEPHFHIWQIVTYAFLHSTSVIWHLLFNMLGLWMFGAEVERYVGPRRLLSLYFASVITAALSQLFVPMLFGAPPAATIGASGGVFGLLLAYAYLFPTRKVIPLIPPIPMPAWLFAALYAGLELFLGVTGSQSGVAHFAHLGGMVGSALVITQWRRRARQPPLSPAFVSRSGTGHTMKMQTLRKAVLAWLLLCVAVPAHAEWVRRITDGIMGTRITVELWSDDKQKAETAIDALLAEMRHIDDSMSTYKPSSEVSQVNAKAALGPMRISKELFDLLTTAKEYSVLTDGAFDITYASVGYMYDFRKHIHPDEAQIDQALPAINYRHVLLDPKHQTVQFSQKGVRIDLGGIAKGYSVDRGIDVLKSFGFTRMYVSAGGDSRIVGDRFGKPWVVGIRDPSKGEGEVITRIPLVDAAISTSGDYERFFEENGVRYHHIIDPHTGHSASKVRSATVIGPYATRTDGLSKTAFVLGPEKAMEIYNRIDDIDAIIVKLDGSVIYSKGIEPARRPAPAK